ncbi:protein translocase subunit SecF [Salicola sp. Rm-C-2C1-2]|uniref:protein translocase subunit SecF n=1 Tax=Salicola sp. Rm-C-2C1-2 TaxID=3141321 RepID=UPI0032E43EF3
MSEESKKHIDFMGVRRIAAAVSIILVLGAVISLGVKGLALGLDFTGGSLVELEYAEAPELPDVRSKLESAGYDNAMVQNFGSDKAVLIRLPAAFDDSVGTEVVSALSRNAELTLERSEYVGGQVGEELREQGGIALLLAFFVVLIYVAMRFQLKFGLASVVPLVHDVLIVLGIFSVFQLTFDLTVLAALLAVIGYSLNDTIIVSDRIRENFRRILKGEPEEIINISLNQVLLRTIVTSGTTLVVLISLLVFGGEMIRNFALALFIGVLVGTYSSIYVAANMLVTLNVNRDDLYVPQKEGAEGSQPEEEDPPDWLKRMD